MDTNPELILRAVRRPCLTKARRGIAMVTAIFGLVIVGILAAGMYNLATLHAKAVRNRTAATRALLLAESAAAHAVMLARDTLKKKPNSAFLRGSDNTVSTTDDSLLIGFGLSSGVQIPATGFATSQGRYWVKFRDDAADTDGDPFRDSNMRIIARCTAATPDSAYATIDVLISGVSQMPGFFSNGNFSLGGNNSVTGACGDVHANGNLSVGNPGPALSGTASATGTVSNGGSVEDETGAANPAVPNQPPLDVPPLRYNDFCPGRADYILRSNGTIENHNVFPISRITAAGLTYSATSPQTWTSGSGGLGNLPGGGIVCVEGNLDVGGNTGTALTPVPVTLVATQSIRIQGTPYLKAATTDSILLVAGADAYISGNAAGGATSYEGLIYANSQCFVGGSVVISGNVVCRDAPHTVAAHNWATGNSISGSARISYGCGGYFNQPRRILQWVQVVQ